MLTELIEELKAKVTARCGMQLTHEEVVEVLTALTSAETVQEAQPGVEAKKETLPAPEPPPEETPAPTRQRKVNNGNQSTGLSGS